VEAPSVDPARRPPKWMAPVFVAVGICIAAAALGVIPIDQRALAAPRWVVGCSGGLFALAGLLIASQDDPTSLHAKLLAASFFSMFAAVFAWVGFGPGPRAFSSTMSFGGFTSHAHSGETSGRVMFGTVAVIVGLVAVAAWWNFARALRKALRRS
jgi:hypothetical protein